MARARRQFRCGECGGTSLAWAGRCSACGAWNVLAEEALEADAPAGAVPWLSSAGETAVPIADVGTIGSTALPTGVSEFDRVLGGGLVPGSVTLVGGEPGIGKSTLLTQAAACMAAAGSRVLYFAAEESPQQVRLRAERLAALVPELWLVGGTSVPALVAHLDQVKPDVVVVDSIQAVYEPGVGSAPGSVAQVRGSAHRLVVEAKRRGTAMVLVGHVTKDGNLAGPRALEHLVDTVLTFEGDRHHALRLMRAVKHRFGSTADLGVFEMGDVGLVPVPDASGLLLADRRPGVAGSAVVPALDGHRPLLVELQALVARSSLAMPRRSAQGLDPGRMALLLAVLEQRLKIPLTDHDVFALAVGGVRVVEPGADLGLALAVLSARADRALPADLVVCGEVGLAGELRSVRQLSQRLSEAARLGFRRAIVPASSPTGPPGLAMLRAATLGDAVELAFAHQPAAAA
ncbi:MAG: DNA repair protein RadA [Acidimicrobiia bacterium]